MRLKLSILIACDLLAFASTARLSPRSSEPKPISIPPSQNWDGDDGPWSSFTVQVGTPSQNVRVFVSSVLSSTWVVRADGCVSSQNTCQESRGRTFDPQASTSWKQLGNYDLAVNQNLGPYIDGELGNDTLDLGIQGSGGPTLPEQAIVAYTSQSLQLGMFGANAVSPNSTSQAEATQSYLMSLKKKGLIPSLSFGYTAGNQYRLKQVFGSLTLGGFDSSLFTPNSLTIPFTGTDPSRFLQATIQGITAKDQSGKTTKLLSNSITVNVDSTASMIWLPQAVCKQFEDAFSLKWDPKTSLYFVDDNLHSQLQEQNTSVTFTISNQTSGGQSTDITLPYNSFDLYVNPPYSGIGAQQRYFPLQRANNASQYTLGRTFFQEAYLTVDWDRRNFSLSQCNYTTAQTPNLVSIYSPGEEPKSSLSSGSKVGIGIGVVVGILLIVGAVLLAIYLKRRKRRLAAAEAAKTGINPKEGLIRQGFAKGEMGTGIDNARFEMEGSDGNALKPYGGRTPPWVDEKAQYPGLASPDLAEIDGIGHRAELGAAQGFFGGRGVHEMYDPSSVPPIELPTSSSEVASHRGELEGSSSAGLSPRSPLSRATSSGKPSPVRSPGMFGFFNRRSRAQSGTTEQSSSGVSGPSSPASPKRAERAFGSRGQAQLISIHRSSGGRSLPSNYDQPLQSLEAPPPLPTKDHLSLGRSRPSYRSNTTDRSITSVSSNPSEPSSSQPPADRQWGQLGQTGRSQRSTGERSSGPSAPSSPRSPAQRPGRRRRGDSQVSAPSSGHDNEAFSPVSRRGTRDLLSPISPDEGSDRENYGPGFSRFR